VAPNPAPRTRDYGLLVSSCCTLGLAIKALMKGKIRRLFQNDPFVDYHSYGCLLALLIESCFIAARFAWSNGRQLCVLLLSFGGFLLSHRPSCHECRRHRPESSYSPVELRETVAFAEAKISDAAQSPARSGIADER